MSDLRKGKDWYEDMPLDIQIVYLENITDDQLDIVYDMYFENFSAFLSESFIWKDTKEGYDFWLNVSQFYYFDI